MRLKLGFVGVFVLVFWAGTLRAAGFSLGEFERGLREVDVLILDGAVKIDRDDVFQIQKNSSELLPGREPGAFGRSYLLGGLNQSKKAIRVAGFIPMSELRGKADPQGEIVLVKVNGKSQGIVLLTGAENKLALGALKKKFAGNPLLDSQTGPDAPNLWIPPVALEPGAAVEIRYESKPHCCVSVRPKVQ